MEDQLKTSRSSVPMVTIYVTIVRANLVADSKLSQYQYTLLFKQFKLGMGALHSCTDVLSSGTKGSSG